MPAPDPAAVTLEPLSPDEFAGYRARFIVDWAGDLARVDDLAVADAISQATQRTDASLPDGVATVGHHLLAIRCRAARVGTLWLSVDADRHGFLDDLTIDEAVRGQGYGRRALERLEAYALDLGLTRIDLHVYRDNPTAIALYERHGYRTTGLKMRKVLPAAP